MKFRKVFALVTIGSLGLLACSGENQELTQRIEPAPSGDAVEVHGVASPAQPFSQTVVRFRDDGTRTVDIYYRSAREDQVNRDAVAQRETLAPARSRSAQPLSLTFSPCFGASLFLWDSPTNGNELCFFGTAQGVTVHLTDYPRNGSSTWAGAIDSFRTSTWPPGGPYGGVQFFTLWSKDLQWPPPETGEAGVFDPTPGSGPVASSFCGYSIAPRFSGGGVLHADACVHSAVALGVWLVD